MPAQTSLSLDSVWLSAVNIQNATNVFVVQIDFLRWKGVSHTMRMNMFLPLLCLGLVLLAGCGYNGNATTSTGNSVTATTVPRVTPATTPTATVMPTGTPASGSGGVFVHLSASGYHAHDTIVVTITNGTSQTISFADHQSNCTIVLLQHQNATTWEPVSLCKLMTQIGRASCRVRV